MLFTYSKEKGFCGLFLKQSPSLYYWFLDIARVLASMQFHKIFHLFYPLPEGNHKYDGSISIVARGNMLGYKEHLSRGSYCLHKSQTIKIMI